MDNELISKILFISALVFGSTVLIYCLFLRNRFSLKTGSYVFFGGVSTAVILAILGMLLHQVQAGHMNNTKFYFTLVIIATIVWRTIHCMKIGCYLNKIVEVLEKENRASN